MGLLLMEIMRGGSRETGRAKRVDAFGQDVNTETSFRTLRRAAADRNYRARMQLEPKIAQIAFAPVAENHP